MCRKATQTLGMMMKTLKASQTHWMTQCPQDLATDMLVGHHGFFICVW